MDQNEMRGGKPGVNDGRRRLIKAAAIAGGAVAAAGALPGDWKRPLATVGGLPAHAQTSAAQITIPDNSLVISTNQGDVRGNTRFVLKYYATFSYVDPLCEIDDAATLWARVGPCNLVRLDNAPLSGILGMERLGTTCEGTIKFMFEPCDLNGGSLEVQLSKGTRHSNIVTGSFVGIV